MAATATKTIRYWWQSDTGSFQLKWDRVWNDANGTFTDLTTGANDATTANITITGTASTSRLYFGMTSTQFDFIRLIFSTTPTVGTRTWEYWNGSAWTALSPTAQTGSVNLTGGSTHELKWTPPSDWATTAINSVTCYYVRATVGTGYTVAGVGSFFLQGALKDFSQITIDVPENTSRTVTAAILKFYYNNDYANKTVGMTQIRCSCKLGSASLTYVHDQSSNFNVQMMPTQQLVIDATSYFVSNLGSGTTQTFQPHLSLCQEIVGSAISAPTSIDGITCELILTYKYDATSQDTRVKTVIIPLESQISSLTTSLVELGTNQIPALDTFLPESSKVYKNIMLVIGANDCQSSVGTRTLSYALDAASATTVSACISSGNVCEAFNTFAVDLSAMTTNAAHAIKFKTSSTSVAPYSLLACYLVVTYTYSHTSSTSFINSLQMPIQTHGEVVEVDSTNVSAARLTFYIEEPSTISLVQSGVLFRWDDYANEGNSNPSVIVGSQTHRDYSTSGISGPQGDFALIQRIDSGGAKGAGITLARGPNNLDVQFYAANNNAWGLTAMALLNYTSGKAAGGDNTHNHTIVDLIAALPDTTATVSTVDSLSGTITPSIVESNYWLSCFGVHLNLMFFDTAQQHPIGCFIKRLSGEGVGAGMQEIFAGTFFVSANFGTASEKFANIAQYMKRWPNDWNASQLMDPKAAHAYRFQSYAFSGHLAQAILLTTYNSITFSVSGTVSGYTGDGSGITVYAHRNDTGERIASATTAAGGGFAITVPTSDVNYFAVAQQDGTHVGVSAQGAPT